MKFAILIVSIILATGCKHTNFTHPPQTRKLVVTLMDSLGTISLYVPRRYDTIFTWIHENDTRTCEAMKCRFQPTKLPINMESGWISRMSVDSVDCLTISYFPYAERNMDTTYIPEVNKGFKERLEKEGTANDLVLDTLYRIFDRPFSVTATKYFYADVHRYVYELTAVSLVKSVAINFNFKLITDKEDAVSSHFMQNSLDILQTVRFDKSIR